jgi:hypothetical protein
LVAIFSVIAQKKKQTKDRKEKTKDGKLRDLKKKKKECGGEGYVATSECAVFVDFLNACVLSSAQRGKVAKRGAIGSTEPQQQINTNLSKLTAKDRVKTLCMVCSYPSFGMHLSNKNLTHGKSNEVFS